MADWQDAQSRMSMRIINHESPPLRPLVSSMVSRINPALSPCERNPTWLRGTCPSMGEGLSMWGAQVLSKAYNLRSKTRLEHLRTGLPPMPPVEPGPKHTAAMRTQEEQVTRRRALARDTYYRRRSQQAVLAAAQQADERLCPPR